MQAVWPNEELRDALSRLGRHRVLVGPKRLPEALEDLPEAPQLRLTVSLEGDHGLDLTLEAYKRQLVHKTKGGIMGSEGIYIQALHLYGVVWQLNTSLAQPQRFSQPGNISIEGLSNPFRSPTDFCGDQRGLGLTLNPKPNGPAGDQTLHR